MHKSRILINLNKTNSLIDQKYQTLSKNIYILFFYIETVT